MEDISSTERVQELIGYPNNLVKDKYSYFRQPMVVLWGGVHIRSPHGVGLEVSQKLRGKQIIDRG